MTKVMQAVSVTKANFVPYAEFQITSPANTTYNSNILQLDYVVSFTVTEKKLVVYSLDGAAIVTVFDKQTGPQFWETYPGSVALPKLSDGSHHLVIYGLRDYSQMNFTIGSAEVYFTIDTKPPTISNLSVENQICDSTNVTLSFNVDEAVTQISYSLDNQANVTLDGNSTLTGLTEGSHTITVDAKDEAGNTGTFGPVSFTVQLSRPISAIETKPDLFPLVAVSMAVAAVIVVAALVYVEKRKPPGEGVIKNP